MAITRLTKDGENFIRSKCNGSGNSKLQGSAANKNGIVLPYCNPLTSINKVWISNPDINGNIETNSDLGDALIKWYNKYAEIYSMDANILAAQAYQESNYIIWNYAINSTASGIGQFIDLAVFDVIVCNTYGNMTTVERQAITKNIINYTFSTSQNQPRDVFLVDYPLGRKNRAILHQNIIDNPEIMIKAQFEYMKYISNKCDYLASCTLFGYSRGPSYIKSSSYSDAINAATKKGNSYENEGIDYVYKIFSLLYNNFGYKDLNITTEAAENFDKFNATLG